MRLLRDFTIGVAAMTVAGSAFALAGPKVSVTYSMEERDGGRYVTELTGTALGAGDGIFVMSIDDDCKGSDPYGNGEICGSDKDSNVADVYSAGETASVEPTDGSLPGPVLVSAGDSPQRFTIEYTANGAGNVIAGPVELVGLQTSHLFEINAAGGLATSITDLKTELAIGTTGTYDGIDTITWNGAWATSGNGLSNCGGSPAICSLATPIGGWPRVEDGSTIFIKNGNPAGCPARPGLTIPPLPTFEIGAGQSTADSNAGTRDSFQDDILAVCDNQAITYQSWYGVEISRTFTAAGAVPVLGPLAQWIVAGAVAGSGGLMAWRRRREA